MLNQSHLTWILNICNKGYLNVWLLLIKKIKNKIYVLGEEWEKEMVDPEYKGETFLFPLIEKYIYTGSVVVALL